MRGDAEPVRVFYSYAHEDEEYRMELVKHLRLLQRQGLIESWHDRRIEAGAEWASEIDAQLEAAQLILLLISSDFIASNYCFDIEMRRALERHATGEARVIPVIVRRCDWESIAPLAKLQALPRDATPISEWEHRDAAFTEVAKRIRALVDPARAAARLQDRLMGSLDRRELPALESERRENEERLALAVDDMRELVRMTAADARLADDSTAEGRVMRVALGTLAIAEEDYDDARRLVSATQAQAATEAALAASRVADEKIDGAVQHNLVRGDAAYGLSRWEQALESYKVIVRLLERHSTRRVGGVNLASLGPKIAVCHFQRQLELQRTGRLLDKARVWKHFQLLKKTIIENSGPERREQRVRFGWEGALRRDGVPRPWARSVYVTGRSNGVERRFEGETARVELRSDDASFALSTVTNVHLDRHPTLSWEWKAVDLPEDGDLRHRATDDAAISLALTFLDGERNWRHLYYSWDSNAPVGTFQTRRLPLPITSLTFHNKVATSGWEHLDEWVPVQVDVLGDIRRHLGCPEPIRVVMLSVQANSQHTHAATRAWMGPLDFLRG